MEKKTKKKVEKVECEVVNQQNYLTLKTEYDNIDSIINSVRSLLDSTVKNYLKIGYLLSCIDDETLKKLGFESIYDFSKANFDLGITSTKNFINVYKRFAIIESGSENLESAIYHCQGIALKDEYEEYSMSQLVELLPVNDSDLENYNPEMTTKEIRMQKKQSQLTDYEQYYYSLVEKRFKEIWSLVILDDDIKCAFNQDSKMLFNKESQYQFKLDLGKEKINVILDGNVYDFRFSFRFYSQRNGYFQFKVLHKFDSGKISLNEEIDCKAIADKISHFINNDCKDFILDYYSSSEKQKAIDENNKRIYNILDQIESESENKFYRLSDFNKGIFFDLIEALKPSETYKSTSFGERLNEVSQLGSIYHHAIFSWSDFRIKEISRSSMTVICPVVRNHYLYLVIEIDLYDIDIHFEYIDEDNAYSFDIRDAFYLYPDYLKEYILVDENSTSLFSIYFELAQLWMKSKEKEE